MMLNNSLKSTAIVVSCSEEYLSRYNILESSISQYLPGVDILLFYHGWLPNINKRIQVSINKWLSNTIYTETWEQHCSIRAKMIQHAFSMGYEKVILVGADTEFFDCPKAMIDLLETNNIVFTPYTNYPLPVDKLYPNAYQTLQIGQINADMIGLRNTPETIEFLKWLDTTLANHIKYDNKLLLDQVWWSYAFSLLDKVVVLRTPGYNVQYCSVDGMHQVNGKWFMKDGVSPLTLFHYAGYNNDNVGMSRHQNRFKADKTVEEFYGSYGKRLFR